MLATIQDMIGHFCLRAVEVRYELVAEGEGHRASQLPHLLVRLPEDPCENGSLRSHRVVAYASHEVFDDSFGHESRPGSQQDADERGLASVNVLHLPFAPI